MTNPYWISIIKEAKGEKYSTLSISGPMYDLLYEIPPEIGMLTNLKSLNLSKNLIDSISPEIGKLTNLVELNLSDTIDLKRKNLNFTL